MSNLSASSFTLTAGVGLLYNGIPYTVHKAFPQTKKIQLIRQSDESLLDESVSNILEAYRLRRLKVLSTPTDTPTSTTTFAPTLDDYSEKARKKYLRDVAYVDAFFDLRRREITTEDDVRAMILEVADRINDDNPPGNSSVRRWVAKVDRHCGDRFVLLPQLKAERPTKGYTPLVRKTVVDLLEQHYGTTQRLDLKEVYETHIAPAFKDNPSRMPSYATVRRWLLRYTPAFQMYAKRYSPSAARAAFRSATPSEPPATILEQVELDFTPLDIWVLDEARAVVLGRVQFAVLIDRKSRMPLGFSLTYGGESTEALFQCIRHAILPKTYISEKYPNIRGEWPACGMFKRLRVDNGLANHSKALAELCAVLGCELEFCPTKQPWLKGIVESFIGKCNRLMHTLPGTTFAHFLKRDGYDPAKHAALTKEDLNEVLHRWIVDQYIVDYHQGIKRTPLEAWEQSSATFIPPLPIEPERLNRLCGIPKVVALNHGGIRMHTNLRYSSTELNNIRLLLGAHVRVEIRWYPYDLGHIYVKHPETGEFFEVYETDQAYSAGLTAAQHREIQRQSKQKGQSRMEAKQGLADFLTDTIAKKRPGGSSKAPPTGIPSGDGVANSRAVSPLANDFDVVAFPTSALS